MAGGAPTGTGQVTRGERASGWRIVYSAVYWPYLVLSAGALFFVALGIFLVTFPFDRKRRLLHRFTCAWAAHYLAWAPLASVRVEGRERVTPGRSYIFVSNHLSMVDILAVFATYFDFLWISKLENFYAPFLGWNMVLNGYVPLKRGHLPSILRMVRTCQRKVRAGHSLFLFPEGTRSPNGEMQAFYRGAFYLAVKNRIPVVPLVIEGTNRILPKHSMSINPGPVRVQVLEPVDPADVDYDESRLRALVRERMLAAMRRLPEAPAA